MKTNFRPFLWGCAVFAGALLLLQVLVKPLPAMHPLFPFITLEDRDLPFFNARNFHDTVYAWYALDDYIAQELAQKRPPLGNVNSQEYSQILLKKGNKSQSPISLAVQQSSLEIGSDPLFYEIAINSFGCRGHEFAAKRDPQTLRIVALGDSLTFGFGVAEQDTWVHHLREQLEKLAPSNLKVEVINAGVISFDSTLGVEFLRKKILPLQPDWVLIGFGFNDYNFNNRSFLGNKGATEDSGWKSMIRKQQSWKGQVIYQVSRLRLFQVMRLGIRKLLQSAHRAKATQPKDFTQMKDYLRSVRGHHATSYETYRQNIQTMLDELKARNIHGFLLNSNVTSSTYHDILVDLARQNQVPFADFRAILIREITSKEPEPDVSMEVPVLFRVEIPKEVVQRKPQIYVIGDYFSGVALGIQELLDTGEEGDRVYGDQIYSGVVWIEYGTMLSFRFLAVFDENKNDWLEEFDGWRIYRRFDVQGGFEQVGAEIPKVATPIYPFNDLSDQSYADFLLKPLMAETCHPNSRGHEVLGREIGQMLARSLSE